MTYLKSMKTIILVLCLLFNGFASAKSNRGKASDSLKLQCQKTWGTTSAFTKKVTQAILGMVKKPETETREGKDSINRAASLQYPSARGKITPKEDRTVIIDDNSVTKTVKSVFIRDKEGYGLRIIGSRPISEYILDSNGKKIGFFKEAGTYGNPPLEILAYELCRSIGCRVVPETKYAKFRKREGSYQTFVGGVTRENMSSSDRDVYIETLRNPDSTIRKDFDEMVILDLIGGALDRSQGNYIIDMNEERLYVIDNSQLFYDNFAINSKWIEDAKKAKILQTPISERMKHKIMQINFEEIQHVFLQNGFFEVSTKKFHLRIKILQSILQENPDATLEELIDGFKKPITLDL